MRKARKKKQEGNGEQQGTRKKEDGKEESRKSKAHPYTLRPLTPDRPPQAEITGINIINYINVNFNINLREVGGALPEYTSREE